MSSGDGACPPRAALPSAPEASLARGGAVHPGVQGVFPAGAAPQGSVRGGQRTGGHRGTVGAAHRTEFSLARSLRSLFLGDSLPLDSRPSLVSHYNASPHIRFISVYALCYTISTRRRREEKKKKKSRNYLKTQNGSVDGSRALKRTLPKPAGNCRGARADGSSPGAGRRHRALTCPREASTVPRFR